MHRWYVLITVQLDATQSRLFIILQAHSTCFGCQPHPSLGINKTVTTASGTGHIFCAVVEAVVTVLCTPDDRCGWHPKHVEWTCRIINRLLCVASCWTVINMHVLYFSEAYKVKVKLTQCTLWRHVGDWAIAINIINFNAMYRGERSASFPNHLRPWMKLSGHAD